MLQIFKSSNLPYFLRFKNLKVERRSFGQCEEIPKLDDCVIEILERLENW